MLCWIQGLLKNQNGCNENRVSLENLEIEYDEIKIYKSKEKLKCVISQGKSFSFNMQFVNISKLISSSRKMKIPKG